MKNDFYVYVYYNPLKKDIKYDIGLVPFYVGKGQNERYAHHIKTNNLKNDTNKHRANTIKKIIKAGLQPTIIIAKENLTEKEAFKFEKQLIKQFGRADKNLGPLTNLTDGGEGKSGAICSKQTKQKISKSRKKFIESLNGNHSMFATMKGRKQSMEACQKMSKNVKLALAKPSAKANRSRANLGKNNPRAKPCCVFGIKFNYIGEAERILGLDKRKLKQELSFYEIVENWL